jgi:hypothetical protein
MNDIDKWIPQEQLPTRAGLKVIRTNHPNYGLSQDEIQDRNEFIRCHLLKEFELLLMIPQQETEDDFFISDYSIAENSDSAFNTVDFQRQLRPFNKYAYAIKKIMEHIKDLAIMHSCCTQSESRHSVNQKYEAVVANQFRDQLLRFVDQYTRAGYERRHLLKQKIGKLNQKILECKKIWERYAPAQNWDL